MTAAVSTINCPNCGAGLCAGSQAAARDDLWPCLYCGVLVRVAQPAAVGAAPAVSVEREVPPEIMARLRELVMAGQRSEAVELCVREGGVTRAAAEAAVDGLVGNVAHSVIFSQTLSGVGVLIFLGAAALLVAGVVLPALSMLPWWAGILMFLFGLLNVMVLKSGFVASLRFRSAKRGTAEVLQITHVGTRQVGKQGIAIYFLGVEVHAPGRPSFHTRLSIAARPQSVAKIFLGARLPVRYRPDDPTWLRFDVDAAVPQTGRLSSS